MELTKTTSSGAIIGDSDFLTMQILQKIFNYKVEIVRKEDYPYDIYTFTAPNEDFPQFAWDENNCDAVLYKNGKNMSDGFTRLLPPFLNINSDQALGDDEGQEWKLVEKMYELGYRLEMKTVDNHGKMGYVAMFSGVDAFSYSKFKGDNPQFAIVVAALQIFDDSWSFL